MLTQQWSNETMSYEYVETVIADKVLDELDRRYAPKIKALQASERITEDDLKLIVHSPS